LADFSNYNTKVSAKCHMCHTNKHKTKIQYGKCTNAASVEVPVIDVVVAKVVAIKLKANYKV